MIHLFNHKTSKNDLIQFNGEYIIDDICSKAVITEELNGEYSFEGIFKLINNFPIQAYDLLVEGSLIKINDEYGEEYFRIASVDKNRYEIEIYARHITISDILTMWCEDVRPENQNGNGAINWIFDNAIGSNPFQVTSDISNTSTAYYVNKTVYEALFTADNSFLERWGGEVYRRGFNIDINSKVGTDRGVSIRSRKNLLGFEASTNLNELTTRIYPKGFDGITINEKYVDSELINNYASIYAREYKFDDIRVNDEYYTEGYATLEEAQDEMKRRCKLLYEKDKIDVINASYRVDFVELGKTEEYKNYSILEKTWVGDTVNVTEENLNIDINVRVLKRQFDVKKNERINTELSNKDTKVKPPTIGDIITEIEKIPDTDNILQQAKDQATAIINAGMKNSYVIVRKNEILIMDTDDINTAVKVWRWNNGGLGYSSTGYFGQYGTAITNDGAIVANFITTGVLNANIIKTGIIKAQNGESFFNLETGEVSITGTLKSQKGDEFVSLDSGGLSFQDWNRKEQMLRMATAYFSSNRDMNGIQFAMPRYSDFIRFAHVDKADLTDGWSSSDTQYKFFDLWSGDFTIDGYTYKKGVNAYAPIYMRGNNSLQFVNSTPYTSEIKELEWNGLSTLLGVCGDNGVFLGYKTGDSYQARIVATEAAHPGTGDYIKSWGNWNFSGYTFHNAGINAQWLEVSGSKNCLQETENYGERLINAYETAEYYFGDIGSGTINEEGECLVYIDDIFKECVNTDVEYHVFTQIYNGDIISIERFKTYFVVKGEIGTKFVWELKAKRIGYENNRLDAKDDLTIGESGLELFGNEDFKSNTSEEILNEVLEFNLENVLLGGTNK